MTRAGSPRPAPARVSPLDILLPYQRRWFDDGSEFKIGLMSRQVGKSFACAAECVTTCLTTASTEWVVLSAGERQALEFMRKVRDWAEAYKLSLDDYIELRDSAEALLKSAEVRWPNKSRIVALPANPDTARGYSANVVLDEFAFHEDPDAVWRALYPSITNRLRGTKCIRVVSTPNGRGNKFSDLWHSPPEAAWSKHRVTIHDAVQQGLPIDIESLRRGLDDPEGWAQEYECEFLDSSAVLLPYDVIATCEHPEATDDCSSEYWQAPPPNPLYIGIDFGRRRDLTVAWSLEQIGDVLWTREVLVLRKMPTDRQVELLRPRIARARRVCIDTTGAGTGMGDYLIREFGEFNAGKHSYGRIEPCNFSAALKAEIFSHLRMRFDARGLRIPATRAIREDLHSIHRMPLRAGGVTYRAPHTEDGHADRCTALALAVRAAEAMPVELYAEVI